jgi:hypothetical protein
MEYRPLCEVAFNGGQWRHGVNRERERECTMHSIKQGACHMVALPFTLKSILRQEKNYGNSNISPCKNIIFKKSSKRNQNP